MEMAAVTSGRCGSPGHRLAVEAAGLGVAAGSGLCWAGACLVGSFRPGGLAAPYWGAVPWLRTDTAGIVSFALMGVALVISESLRLARRRDIAAWRELASRRAAPVLAVAIAETTAVLSTGLIAYLSVNAVTHPETLALQATHLAAWPTEGTLRVLALLACVASVSVLRYLRVKVAKR
jgi:hypothetical protein